MQENDRAHLDDDSNRPDEGTPRAPQAPVARLVANPRRVRRA